MTLNCRLLIFCRFPEAGKAKTRLIPALGAEKAAQLHRRMTEYIVGVARSFRNEFGKKNILVTVYCTGAPLKDFRAWLGHDLHYRSQPSGTIGQRMQRAIETVTRENEATGATIIIGTDIPGLTADIISRAREGLNKNDVVLGPAADGGYYLIGMKSAHQDLFKEIDWGTEQVFEQTRKKVKGLDLRLAELPILSDVDRPNDLDMIRSNSHYKDIFDSNAVISVIIPTLNEAPVLGATLKQINRAENIEVIVVDGGSHDNSREIALKSGATILKVSQGRAAQLNRGASVAQGQILLFLHADTILPAGYANMIIHALDNPATVAGAFRFKTNDSRLPMRVVEWVANFRSTKLKYPYGDQGLFMKKRMFEEVGGFATMPIMEDLELVHRLRCRGRIITLPREAITSARRWQRLGIFRTTMINQLMILGLLCGMPIKKLADLYRRW